MYCICKLIFFKVIIRLLKVISCMKQLIKSISEVAIFQTNISNETNYNSLSYFADRTR